MNNKRALLIILLMLVFFAVLIYRLFDIQITRHEDYDYYAKNQQIEKKALRAERGYIYDRNGELLAYDRNDVSFFVDLRMAKQKQRIAIADTFAATFGKSRSHYLALMNAGKRVICIEQKAPREKSVRLQNLIVNGLFSREDPTRIYSYDNLASHVLGYVGEKYAGIDGIEKYYDKTLTGQAGQLLIERDVRGRMVTVAEEATIKPVPGDNLVLTIDKNYQAILEEELRKGLNEFKGSGAIGIIMDPNNGEILALANMPDYNPNKFWNFPNDARRNRALIDTYEPGSTFKSLALAVLMDKHLCRTNEMVYTDNGKYKYKKVNITDSHKHQWLSVREVLEQSSNIGMAKLISRLDEETFYKYLRNFGFGNITFVDLPGESKGKLKKPASFNELTKSFMSFGYEVSVTPLQIAAGYCSLINGGNLYQPHIVKKIVTRDGSVREEIEPKMLRNVISAETSQLIKNLLVGVVENGTAKTAKVENVSVGGKTGTSQQLVNNRYSSSSHNSSFVGFFPAENPKVVCYIMVTAPQVGMYGGVVAAPVFKKIAERLVASDINLASSIKVKEEKQQTIDAVFTSNAKGDKGGTKYANYSKREEIKIQPKVRITDKKRMPDLKGFPLRDALAILAERGIKYKIEGKGKIASQSINAGDPIRPGMTCFLKCD